MATKTFPAVSINTLEKSNLGAVWVTNQTKGAMRSAVQFAVPKMSGQGTDAVIVPVTFIPINLTEQVAKRQLLSSADFRKAINRGLLRLISDEEAETLLGTPVAQSESTRLQRELLQLATGEVLSSTGTPEEKAEEVVPSGISARVVSFASMLPEATDEQEALATVMSMGELEQAEKDYIKKAAHEKGFAEIVAYLEQ